MHLQGKRIGVLVDDLYEDQEFWYPYYRLKEEGANVEVIAEEAAHTYLSKHNYPARSTVAARLCKAGDFDALIIPGGFAPDKMRTKPELVELVHQAAEQGKLIAAICHGPSLLVSANVLRGKQATCYKAIKDDVVNAGAEFRDGTVVADGNLITSRTPDDLPHFLRAIIEALSS